MKDSKLFLDTNILVYAYDVSAGNKHDIARTIVTGLWESGSGWVSIQVLQEFYTIVTKKIQKPLHLSAAKELIEDLLKWNIVINDGKCILKGIELQMKFKYSFWDSMIIQAAIRCGAEILLSEDLSAGHVIEGVEIKNPFIQ